MEEDRAIAAAESRKATRIGHDGTAEIAPRLAVEAPVAMVYNGIGHAVLLATPADLADFALGFSLSENILAGAEELRDLDIVPSLKTGAEGAEGIELRMTIAARRFAALSERRRTLAGATGCGLCGIESLSQVRRPIAPVRSEARLSPEAAWRALDGLRAHQPLNRATGAVHAAALATPAGEILLAREDVGRHNALDKLLGAMAARGLDGGTGFVVLTSRCSFEMVQKAAARGISALVAISAPTTLAIDLATSLGVTLVALARADSMTAYAHGWRLESVEALAR
jgi:formate dehydrogenase accessory protein FdhD